MEGSVRLPSLSLHHVFAGERLQAFSDAVFAIIATIMVIPLKLDREDVAEHGGFVRFHLQSYLYHQWHKYLVYIYSFILTLDVWYSHVGIFSMIEQVDDVILGLNLMCLLFVSFLPYGTGLVSEFPGSAEGVHLAIAITASDIILIGITLVIMLAYAFFKQSLLHPEISQNENIRSTKRAAYVSILIAPLCALLALCFSFATKVPQLAMVFFYLIAPLSAVCKIGLYLYYKHKKIIDKLPEHIRSMHILKIRTETFSDGIFSIVATLIVLDLTTQGIPTPVSVAANNGSLSNALKEQRFVFSTYIISFMVVGLLWFVHYGMMHYMKAFPPMLSFINAMILCVVGGIPFVSGINSLFSDFSEEGNSLHNPNRLLSSRVLSVVVLLTGIGQFFLWTVAIIKRKEILSDEGRKFPAESIQCWKTLVFPILGLVTYFGSFSDSFTSTYGHSVLFLITPLYFVAIKLFFRCHVRVWRVVMRGYYAATGRRVSGTAAATEGRVSKLQVQNGRDDSTPYERQSEPLLSVKRSRDSPKRSPDPPELELEGSNSKLVTV